MDSGSRYGCANARSAIRDWLSDGCTLEQRHELNRHLRGCSDCHQAFIAASASQFFERQDSQRDRAADSARFSIDEFGLVNTTIPLEQQTPSTSPGVPDGNRKMA